MSTGAPQTLTPVTNPSPAASASAGAIKNSQAPDTSVQRHSVDHEHVIPRLLSSDRADSLLARCKTAMMPHFPFVVLSEGVNIQQLSDHKPALLLAILAAAAYDDLKLQRRLGEAFRQAITYRLFCVEARSLEVLQALLVHSAWYVRLRTCILLTLDQTEA